MASQTSRRAFSAASSVLAFLSAFSIPGSIREVLSIFLAEAHLV